VAEQAPPPDDRPSTRRVLRTMLLATAGLYLGYALLGVIGISGDIRYFLLIAGFYFLPQMMLRHDPERQERYQVGPGSPMPPWSSRGLRVAAMTSFIIFPIFVVGFFWFYSRVCQDDLSILSPVLWVESTTPWSGGLEDYLTRLCRTHNGAFWPTQWRLPPEWLEYGGLAALAAVAIEVFAVALPEEVFHRGYLMGVLEEVFPPRARVFGVPFGLAAVLASLLFAVGHLVGMAEAARLATFFPALLFAWLWRKSNSLWAPALFHAASNLLMAVLLASTFPR
jgi:membrane protease YdiL (CAAX protease family)